MFNPALCSKPSTLSAVQCNENPEPPPPIQQRKRNFFHALVIPNNNHRSACLSHSMRTHKIHNQKPFKQMKTIKAIIGKTEIGPFDGLSHGDVFKDLHGNSWILGGGSSWTLYLLKDDLSPDYSNTHPDFQDIDGGMEFKRILSRLKQENE